MPWRKRRWATSILGCFRFPQAASGTVILSVVLRAHRFLPLCTCYAVVVLMTREVSSISTSNNIALLAELVHIYHLATLANRSAWKCTALVPRLQKSSPPVHATRVICSSRVASNTSIRHPPSSRTGNTDGKEPSSNHGRTCLQLLQGLHQLRDHRPVHPGDEYMDEGEDNGVIVIVIKPMSPLYTSDVTFPPSGR